MYKIFIAVLALIVVGCSVPPVESESMQGSPVRGQFLAYEEMCQRNPDSPLCVILTLESNQASSLNARWCEICENTKDAYSWCASLPCRAEYHEPSPVVPEFNEASEPMRGVPVRVKSTAYNEMCERNPASALCIEEK